MAVQRDPNIEQYEKEEREFFARESDKMREKDVKLAELSANTKTEQTKVRGLYKAPALFVLAFWVPILIILNREVPQFIQDFMSL